MTAWDRSAPARGHSIGFWRLCGLLLAASAGAASSAVSPPITGVRDAACPNGAIAVEPGSSIQAAVDLAGDGATFCLKNGVHRAQAIRPRTGQRFYGEGRTILNGSRLAADFRREGRYWVASSRFQAGRRHGECLPSAPACDRPEAVFIDDKPLTRSLSGDALASGEFYVDYAGGTIHFGDDPTNRKVEVTAAVFAFESTAANVSISNITVEKYASAAQKGAIHAREGTGWIVENCDVRLNSGAGISVGTGSRVRHCDLSYNGQIGIEGHGKDIRIEDNHVWSNNIRGFDADWEGGGVKIALSDGVTFRGNHVHDNNGPGLWCDIDCYNAVYEGNLVENNQHIGIFHEISFNAVIRNNVVRFNGFGKRQWFWGADITIAASQDVEVTGNTVTVAAGGCGIMLVDQGRRTEAGGKYKTRNNMVRDNEMSFIGAACAGGASDTKPDDENFAIITDGNNRFDGNVYRVPRVSGPPRFPWGHDVFDWDGFRRHGLEQSGRLVPY